jgi:hypothetical protein
MVGSKLFMKNTNSNWIKDNKSKFDNPVEHEVLSSSARLYVYTWCELSDPGKTKFGQHWVEPGDNPVDGCFKRIRTSMGVRKDIFDNAGVWVNSICDVSSIAKKNGLFYKNSKCDDFLRGDIGFVHAGEVHNLPIDVFTEKLSDLIIKFGGDLPTASLATWQYRVVQEMLESNKPFRALADMCPRSGKTITVGSLVIESAAPITLVSSYVLPSFTSFKNDLMGFEQFRKIVTIDCSTENWYEEMVSARSENLQVVLFLSLCKGGKKISNRDKRIAKIFKCKEPILLVVDEADYGAYKTGQADILHENFRQKKDSLFLMTGTNSDRAVGPWKINIMTNVSYPEMLFEKRLVEEKMQRGESIGTVEVPGTQLKFFKVDEHRHLKVVDMEFYQMSLKTIVDDYIKNNPQDIDFLPSWSKIAESPVKSKKLIVRILSELFCLSDAEFDEYNIDQQFEKIQTVEDVSMMFLPSTMKNSKLKEFVEITRTHLSNNFVVLGLSGAFGLTNKNSEKRVKSLIEETRKNSPNKRILLIATCMGTRSFSVPELKTVFLCYDGGQAGSTIQKTSRVGTPSHAENDVGRVVSLAFDPQRDDKFDSSIIKSAENIAKSHNLSIEEALKKVLSSVSIFRTTPDGRVKIRVDEYLKDLTFKNRMARVVGAMSDATKLPDNLKEALIKSYFSSDVLKTNEVALTGQTFAVANKKKNPSEHTKKMIEKERNLLREKLVSLCENMKFIARSTRKNTIKEAFDYLATDDELSSAISEEFNMPWKTIRDVVNCGAINVNFIELLKL